MSSSDIAGILDYTKELDRLRKEQDEVLVEINTMHKKLQATPEVVHKHGDTSLSKLKVLYTQAKRAFPKRSNRVEQFAYSVGFFASICTNGTTTKQIWYTMYVMRLSPFMRNRIEAYASLKGEQVAARVTEENADKDEWFVVKVIHIDRETKEVEVLDEEPGDDEEGSGQRTYMLPMSCILPFPKRNDLLNTQEFPTGRHVLAVYPGTTALYKATVISTPRKMKSDEYLLEFDDDEEDGALPQRTVPFHRVVALPEDRRR
ncbi:unnamed protein product [Thlaspi arvense]|uniref:SGF29 C-terminal domain-containing protein n=1 Tax=Thlaspi arvense TaxID=13288 RepID=A0AAU9TDG0_THLAR|nr:unnamed protein product [Thlaspi arvense]